MRRVEVMEVELWSNLSLTTRLLAPNESSKAVEADSRGRKAWRRGVWPPCTVTGRALGGHWASAWTDNALGPNRPSYSCDAPHVIWWISDLHRDEMRIS